MLLHRAPFFRVTGCAISLVSAARPQSDAALRRPSRSFASSAVHFLGSAAPQAIPVNGTESTSERPSSAGPGTERIDPGLLPRTIPGISQEELATRLATYYSEQSAAAEAKQSSEEIELRHRIDEMRRSMPPEQFKLFLQRLEESRERSQREQEKMSRMTPKQLFRYQLRQERRERWLGYGKLAMLVSTGVGSLFFIFYPFFFFEAV